jgi:hypothetical protein
MVTQVSMFAANSFGWWWDYDPEPDPEPDPDIPVEIENIDSLYYDLGQIYDIQTEDGLTLKMLRYHPPGEACNEGSQPILLFSGLISNMNQYLSHSTSIIEDLYDPQVPDDIAEWAEGDENIEDDPMLYYSMAYYLWKMGYDPFFVNYRGTGYGEMKSDMGDGDTSLDVWAIYDVPPAVRKVYEITGQHPVVGGHSTGGLVTYIYLQGCEFKTSWFSGTYVVSNQDKSDERNGITEGPETILGFIALEPAMIAKLPSILDSLLMWMIIDIDIYLDIRMLIDDLLGIFFDDPVEFLVQLLNALDNLIGGTELAQLIIDILNTDPAHMNEPLMYYLLKYTLDNTYNKILSQYMDWSFHKTAREHYENRNNEGEIIPDTPGGWFDRYYYYIDHMDKVRVATICFLATHDGEFMDLVIADEIIENLMEAKTPDSNDEVYFVEGAHIDVPMGTTAPKEVFPRLGTWLEQII